MRARLSDVARHAGVSEATVSRVLNGKPGVADATRQVVLTCLFPAFAQIIETSLAQNGYTLVLCTQTPGGVHEDEYVEMLLDRGVAGIICVSGQHADTTQDIARYLTLLERGLPIVLINGYREGLPAPFISHDDVAAMALSIGHLVNLGHTEVGLVVGPDRYVQVIRKIAGFRQSMQTLLGRTKVDHLIERSLFTVEGGAAAASILIDRGVTAVVCGSDLMALGSIRAARARGLRVPADISVVGYDDSPLIAFTDPPLTTVRQQVQAMGEAAVQALLGEISGSPSPRAEYVFGPELVVRGSTAARSRSRSRIRATGAPQLSSAGRRDR